MTDVEYDAHDNPVDKMVWDSIKKKQVRRLLPASNPGGYGDLYRNHWIAKRVDAEFDKTREELVRYIDSVFQVPVDRLLGTTASAGARMYEELAAYYRRISDLWRLPPGLVRVKVVLFCVNRKRNKRRPRFAVAYVPRPRS